MKIAVFTDTFLPQVNGVVTNVIDLIKELSKKNHQLLVFAPKPSKKISFILKGVKIDHIGGLPAVFYPEFYFTNPISFQILKTTEKFNPDIIHFHTPITIGFNAIITAKYLKKPLVSTFNTYFMEPEYLRVVGLDRFGLDKNRFINRFSWQFARFFYDQSDIIITPSQFTKDDLIKHGFIKPVIKISNGINLPKKLKKPIKNHFGQYFLYVGRLSKEKNISLLITSFKKFSLFDQKTKLLIIGEGPEKNDLKKLVINFHLNNRVLFLGSITHDTLMESNYYSNALAFISASTSETQGLSILEACSFKLPIIAVKARAVTELFNNNGILCQPNNIGELADALKVMTSNENLRSKFSYQSLEIAKKHSLNTTIKELENIYMSLIKK
ncbi:MAG: HAD-superfamily hydrolase, subfamily IIB [Candidatus Roizmanbacteria bacterium GW2011_GWC2_37_13]|uniref:HAD-superfamily hydrolase, subfamily IIB n=1 Tax=Candidatus Roizmanbacteria bacterium GW2011_GWC2_37_13 TaxID=1618486 RepID=A0A0G0GEF8_9BACT|nr:MAG: HAD-superfamily hydrolase, subfamily IIB [Candidatus Roizmanbacteria bacterium GW2011_GWC2_37_13]